MTSHFDRASLPLPRTFYEQELGELRRPDRKGWAKPKSGCPFHASKSKKSFHVNVIDGGFYCFNCEAGGGDVIAFVRQRYGLSFPDALKRLGIQSEYQPAPRKTQKAEPLSLDRWIARRLALAVEYGTEVPSV